jgi:hypothetical protein
LIISFRDLMHLGGIALSFGHITSHPAYLIYAN